MIMFLSSYSDKIPARKKENHPKRFHSERVALAVGQRHHAA